MKYLRWLLFPFSLLYGLAVIIRNWFYDAGLFKSHRFDKPVISIGNLDVGGAGKSPMTEYLIRLLKDQYKLATLSRGYGRETKGYLVLEPEAGSQKSEVGGRKSEVRSPKSEAGSRESGDETKNNVGISDDHSTLTTHHSQLTSASQIGDEPAQFKHKFPDITVAVCEDRVTGINKLLPNHDMILMDDAYQHRAVEPGLSILLFDYNRIDEPHLLLPAGNMREPFSGRWRAQVLVVSKCPPQLVAEELQVLAQKMKPLPYQRLFFTSIAYQGLEDLDGRPVAVTIDPSTTVFLLTGIANAAPLLRYINGHTADIVHHNYPDHHPFTLKNIAKLAAEFSACKSEKKIIVTTEKDAQRLEGLRHEAGLDKLPIFVIPIRVEFLNGGANGFDELIFEYVREHTAYNSIH